jgi:hypothetical protein
MWRALLLVVALGLGAMLPAAALSLARDGKAEIEIVLAAEATPAEQTAARELADILKQVTGGHYRVSRERPTMPVRPRILVGPTAATKAAGVDCSQMGPEQWLIRTVGNNLVIAGGRPRGTLYAAYHFLEDVVGVRWWNPWEESIPRRPTLAVGNLNLSGQPSFRYRDIYMIYGRDGGRFAARNRLNRDGDAKVESQYGGTLNYGPPYHVHTFNLYFPPKQYFATHPEWFSLLKGQRVGEHSQMCLTNPPLRQAFLAKLRETIASSWAAAQAAQQPPPLVYSVSQNDWYNQCECDPCQALAKAEGSEAGPLLEFVNYLADGIKDQYPEVMIDTLAYQYTQKAPLTIKPRDNVIIRLCDTDADMAQAITHPNNTAFREHLQSWARIAKNLRIWDYAVTYAKPIGMPMPTVRTYQPDFRFYLDHNVEGVFTELEYPVTADWRDLKVWMMIKLLENTEADYNKLLDTFLSGFYGPAAAPLKQYLTALEKEADYRQSRVNWMASPMTLGYLHLGFVNSAHKLFDQAEAAVGQDETLLKRVRHARMPLDRATVAGYMRLSADWNALGQPADQAPPDREKVAQRALETRLVQAKMRLAEDKFAAEKEEAEGEMRRYTLLPTSVPLPEKFRHLPPGRVWDYTATMTRNWADVVQVVKDPEAETGVTNHLDLTSSRVNSAEKYVLPMPWGLYGVTEKKFINGDPIKVSDIPGPGYHWYKMGTFPVAPSYYMYFFWSWIIQLDVDNVFDPAKPDQQFEFWARVKFQGPRFPHAKPGEKDAIFVERVCAVKVP